MAYEKPALLRLPPRNEVRAEEPTPLPTIITPKTHGIPVRLTIPAIDVDTSVVPTGASANDIMEAPSSIADVGWYRFGVFPGDTGSALVTGHVDGKNGEPGVFARLNELKPKDTITIDDEDGNQAHFTVRETWSYEPNVKTAELFNQGGGSHLVLITCNGAWDAAKKSYTQRLVVFADAAEK